MKNIIMIQRRNGEIEVDNKLLHFDDAIRGLSLIKLLRPALVVIDLGMTRISGLDCISIIRSNPRNHHIKIIATTKIYNYNLIKEAFELGADFYLSAPIVYNDIIDIYNTITKREEFSLYIGNLPSSSDSVLEIAY